jgi:molybdopterin-guanine dinucleotide biosynthesis protein A
VSSVVAAVVPSVTLVTDRPDEVSFLHLPIISDVYHEAGPLGGLHAALSAARSSSVLLVSCDLPFLTLELLRHLLRQHGSRHVTVPRTDRLHPVCAVYDCLLAGLAERHLKAGQRSMMDFLEAAGYASIELAGVEPPFDPRVLTNVNTPEDLAAARARRE